MLQELPVPDITYAEQLKFASVVRRRLGLTTSNARGYVKPNTCSTRY